MFNIFRKRITFPKTARGFSLPEKLITCQEILAENHSEGYNEERIYDFTKIPRPKKGLPIPVEVKIVKRAAD